MVDLALRRKKKGTGQKAKVSERMASALLLFTLAFLFGNHVL
jgi:hypothetical protein